MSGLLLQHQHRDVDGFRNPPIAGMPPSPPLTRRSTTSPRSPAIGRSISLHKPLSPPPATVQEQLSDAGTTIHHTPRPASTNGSSVSFKDIVRTGKNLGQNPIDYLIPNGSLPAPVSPYFHPVHDPCSLDVPPSMRRDKQTANPVAGIFGNLNYLLDSYLTILASGGSLAVGTGYQSVARKLLDRVETLFARDLGVDGIGWADVLEFLRGSRQKPFLCVLPVRGILARRDEESVICGGDLDAPCTTRELAESVVAGVKARPAMSKVEQWLEEVEQVLKASGDDGCGGKSLTKEDEDEEDHMVCEIIEGILKNNTEENQIKNFRRFLDDRALMADMQRALVRLYDEHPAESITPPIVALYMLLHPELHPILRALSNVADSELELINSGKFDSFLDGATNVVARDEEEELHLITNLDKRLFSVLEGLEDEIEELHTRSLVVRRALKSRKEQILRKQPSMASVANRSVSPVGSRRRPSAQGKPADDDLQTVEEKRRLDEEEWAPNVPTLHVPITPDDSASNITFNRRRRQERTEKINRNDDDRRKEKERKREKKAKKEDEKGQGLGPRFSLKEFAIKSGEFGPGTVVDEEKSEGETMVSNKRKKRKGERRERSKVRCGECGSCVGDGDEEKKKHREHREHRDKDKDGEKEGKKRHSKEKKEERAADKEKEEGKDGEKEKKGETDSLKARGRPS